ncbi:MAG: hypothetical protein AUK35_02145 [Zetaproteobacteria bacterium CG2_30_46_52]|nr:MAG: hypothetical protein AUK35_02145 [Zetaproteobacteria bacterium CG2_30_46_52]
MSKKIEISQAGDKQALICLLAKLRMRCDLQAQAKGLTEDTVDSLSEKAIDALPESTLVHITDAYFIMHKLGVSDAEIFKKIDLQRSILGQDFSAPEGLNLSTYIKWRLKAEFPQMTMLEALVVNMEIFYAIQWFSQLNNMKTDWAKADTYAASVLKTMQDKFEAIKATSKVVETDEKEEQAVEDVITEEVPERLKEKSSKIWLTVLFLSLLGGAALVWFVFGSLDGLLKWLSSQ